MLITLDIQTLPAEATSVASVMPCPHRFDEKCGLGNVLALGRRCAR